MFSRISDFEGVALECRNSKNGRIAVTTGHRAAELAPLGEAATSLEAFEKFPQLVTIYPDDEINSEEPLTELPVRLPLNVTFDYLPSASDWEISFNGERLKLADRFGGAKTLWRFEAEWGGVSLSIAGRYVFESCPDVENEIVTVDPPRNHQEFFELAVRTFDSCEVWPSGETLEVTSDFLTPTDLQAARSGEYWEVLLNTVAVVRDGNWDRVTGV